MEVVVDGNTGLQVPETGSTLRAVFEFLRRTASGNRRVVVSLALDGEVLSRDRQEEIGPQSPSAYSLLEVKTADPVRLSMDTLSGLLAHVGNLQKAHEEAAAMVVSGDYSKALKRLDECFFGWDILVRAVCDIGTLTSADFAKIRAGTETIDRRILKLQQALLRFRTAFELKDVVRIGDIAQHELKPLLEEWRAVLEALRQHVSQSAGAPS